jgi:hypothetical protein
MRIVRRPRLLRHKQREYRDKWRAREERFRWRRGLSPTAHFQTAPRNLIRTQVLKPTPRHCIGYVQEADNYENEPFSHGNTPYTLDGRLVYSGRVLILPGRLEYTGGSSGGRKPSDTIYLSGLRDDDVSYDARGVVSAKSRRVASSSASDGATTIPARSSAGKFAYFGSSTGAGRCGRALRSSDRTLCTDPGDERRWMSSAI